MSMGYVDKKRHYINAHLRFAVLKRDGFRCVYCGATAAETTLQLDHLVPVRRGGKETLENLVTACLDCNIGKKATEIDNPRRCPKCGTPYWDKPRKAA